MIRPVILCVDDERIILSSLKAQLQNNLSTSLQIEVAESAEEALEIINELIDENIEIPLVLADQIMPGMKGDELLGRVKDLLPQTLTIMLTGQASADAVGKAVNKAGLFRYLSKPWDEDDLILTIQSAIDSYAHQQKLIQQSHFQKVINKTLSLALKPLSFDEQISTALKYLVNVPCLSPPSHGAIYFQALCDDFFCVSENNQSTFESSSEKHTLHFKKTSEIPRNISEKVFSIDAEKINQFKSPILIDNNEGLSYYSYPILIEEDLVGLVFIYLKSAFQHSEEIASFLSSFSQAISGMYRLYSSNQALRHSNIQLEHHKHKLEELVEDRTEALNIALKNEADHNAMLIAANKELLYFATTDFLTGLLNRRHFFELAETQFKLSQAQNKYCCLVMIDIDYFKNINDRHGHQTGDELLKKVSNIIQQGFDESSLVSRFGGEEFAVLLPQTSIDSAYTLCQKLLKDVENTKLHTLENTISVTISIGLSRCLKNDSNIEKALVCADKALYEAKHNGRNSISIFNRERV